MSRIHETEPPVKALTLKKRVAKRALTTRNRSNTRSRYQITDPQNRFCPGCRQKVYDWSMTGNIDLGALGVCPLCIGCAVAIDIPELSTRDAAVVLANAQSYASWIELPGRVEVDG